MSATVTVCFRIPVKADAALRKLAKASRRSLNAEVVIAIEEHVAYAAKVLRADVSDRNDLDTTIKRLRKDRTVRAKKGRAR